MKVTILVFVLIGVVSLAAAQRLLTNDDIVKMVQSGIAQDIIIRTILESSVQFTLSPDHLISFKKAGIPDEVVRVMLARSFEVNQAGGNLDVWAKHEASLPRPAVIPEMRRPEPAPPPATPPATPSATAKPEAPPAKASTEPAAQTRTDAWQSALRPVAPRQPTTTTRSEAQDGWGLEEYRPEVAVSGGLNFGPHRINRVGVSGVATVAIGLKDNLAAVGSYAFHSLGSQSIASSPTLAVNGRLQELVGGLRVSLPRRLSPYAEFCVGAVRTSGSSSAPAIKINAANKGAFGGGFGVGFAINPNLGITLNVRILKPVELQWYAHTSLGVYWRF